MPASAKGSQLLNGRLKVCDCYFLGIHKDYWDYLVPVLIPVLIFALGYLLAFMFGKIRERNRLVNIKLQFETWIQLCEEGVEKQIVAYKKMATDVSNLKSLSGAVLGVVPQNLESILTTYKADLLKIYLSCIMGDKTANQKLIFNLISSVEYHHLAHTQSQEYYGHFVDTLLNHKTTWNKKMGALNKLKADLLEMSIEHIIANPNLKTLNEIFEKWYQHGDMDTILGIKETLLKPL